MLPKEFVETYRPKARELTVYGVPLETLERDELLAALAYCLQRSLDVKERLRQIREAVRGRSLGFLTDEAETPPG